MRPFALCAVSLLFTGVAATARAQQPDPFPELEGAHVPERVIDGHVFLSPAFMPTPFLATHFFIRQGFTQLMIPDFPITQNTRFDVDLLGITQRIQLGFRFLDRFELFAFGTGEILTGSSASSVIAAGSCFLAGGGLGGKVRLFRSTESGTELTIRVQGSADSGGTLDFLRLADAFADDPNLTLDSVIAANLGRTILGDTSRREVGGQLLVGQTLGKNFDVQAALGATYSSTSVELYNLTTNSEFADEVNTVDPEASVALGANLEPWVPIGFLLEYSARSRRRLVPGAEDTDWTDPSHLVGLGVHTVHPNFQVGLTFARLMGLEKIVRTDPTSGQQLTSGTPAVHYVQLGVEVAW